MVERRSTNSPVHVVQQSKRTSNGLNQISGYAAVFNEEYVMFEDSGYRIVEVIAPGAFSDVLGNDVRCLFNHAQDNVLGRTENGTLRMTEDSRGLRFTNALNRQTPIGESVYQFVNRGDVSGCSFAFIVAEDAWAEARQADGRTRVQRTITKIKTLFDVGPVTYPAYEQTSVSA
jgi:hypothetical protein